MSKLISFSRSRARSRVRSTSMSTPLPRWVQLDLDAGALDVCERDVLHAAVDVESCRAVVLVHDAAGHRAPVVRAHLDQPADVATPVPWERQRPVDTGRSDLEGVGLLSPGVERRARLEDARDLFGRLGDVVERDTAVLVHRDPEDPAPAGRGDVQRLEIESEIEQRRGQLLDEKLPGLVGGHGRLLDVRLSGPSRLACAAPHAAETDPSRSPRAPAGPASEPLVGAPG